MRTARVRAERRSPRSAHEACGRGDDAVQVTYLPATTARRPSPSPSAGPWAPRWCATASAAGSGRSSPSSPRRGHLPGHGRAGRGRAPLRRAARPGRRLPRRARPGARRRLVTPGRPAPPRRRPRLPAGARRPAVALPLRADLLHLRPRRPRGPRRRPGRLAHHPPSLPLPPVGQPAAGTPSPRPGRADRSARRLLRLLRHACWRSSTSWCRTTASPSSC